MTYRFVHVHDVQLSLLCCMTWHLGESWLPCPLNPPLMPGESKKSVRFSHLLCVNSFGVGNIQGQHYRAANSIFGKIGRVASEEVVLQLIKSKCVPVLLYGMVWYSRV